MFSMLDTVHIYYIVYGRAYHVFCWRKSPKKRASDRQAAIVPHRLLSLEKLLGIHAYRFQF